MLLVIFSHDINGKDACMYVNPFVVELNLVRKKILGGLSDGYNPINKGSYMNLGDLNEELVLDNLMRDS